MPCGVLILDNQYAIDPPMLPIAYHDWDDLPTLSHPVLALSTGQVASHLPLGSFLATFLSISLRITILLSLTPVIPQPRSLPSRSLITPPSRVALNFQPHIGLSPCSNWFLSSHRDVLTPINPLHRKAAQHISLSSRVPVLPTYMVAREPPNQIPRSQGRS